VARYLTQEWLDEARALASDQPERPGATVRMNYVVTGGPDGADVTYYTIVENGRLVESRLGALEDPEVTLTASWEDSVSIARGELDANAAFMQGKVKVVGNMAKLMSLLPLTNGPEYRAVQERVRAITEF
jgi:predicted lipid carrier protein YhbT